MSTENLVWNHPLLFWLRDCALGDPPLVDEKEWRQGEFHEMPICFEEITDGYFMSSLMKFINSSPGEIRSVNRSQDNRVSKKTKFKELLAQIDDFYKNSIGEKTVCVNPDFEILTEKNNKKKLSAEINQVILLVLNCAIKSKKKKLFVDRITKFEKEIQSGLANYIQQLTENTLILDISAYYETTEAHKKNEMKTRDAIFETAHNNEQTEETGCQASTSEKGSTLSENDVLAKNRPTSPESESRFLALQLANVHHENRQLRTQAENKDEECRKLEVELDEKGRRIQSLENERLRLLEKERHVKELNDDLQAARFRIEKLLPLEGVDKKFREAKEEREFFKSKYETVNKKNDALEDAISELEKQIKTLQIENQDRSNFEDSLSRMKNSVKHLEIDIGKKNSEIEALLEDKHRLNYELKEREDRICQLEICSTTTTPRHVDCLADQLEDAKNDELEIMKAEIRKLRAQTEGSVPENSYQISSEEKVELKRKLASEELKNAEHVLHLQKLQVEREQLDGHVGRVEIELQETTVQLEHTRDQRDDAVKCLHEARRKFSQFQSEFGKRLEEESHMKINVLNNEMVELKKKLAVSLEVQTEMDKKIMKIKEENKRALFELDELREEKSEAVIAQRQTERCQKTIEAEKYALKEKLEKTEDELERLKLRLISCDIAKKKLDDRDQIIESLHSEKGELENDLRTIQQQFNVESMKTQRLREDLVFEKSRRADLVGRLRSLCTTLNLNGGSVNVEGINDEDLIDSIDDILMNALVTVKRESDSLRIQQNMQISELSDLKKDIEKLRRSESQSLNESDDRVRELTKENIHTREHVYILQEKLRELNLELSAKCNEIELAKNSIEELSRTSTSINSNNSEIARLQVAIRNCQIQEDLVKNENIILREELMTVEKKNKKQADSLEELETMHRSLLADHSRLQHLHNLLTQDYDEAKKESTEMKHSLQTVPRQQTALMNTTIQKLETKLSDEVMKNEKQSQSYASLEKEHNKCRANMESLRHEVSDYVRICDNLKTDLQEASDNSLKRSDFIDELNNRITRKTSEVGKLNNKIEALNQLNRTYNEENKNLSRQLEILLTQNKELLQRALHDKDQYHLEMKDFQDQLSALRRHKEKLEDKIMDQYRTMDNKKSPERKQPLVKRAAKALINRRRALSNGGSTTEDSSAYSADERGSPPLADYNDNLPPTCSSSDDHERNSPSNEVSLTPFRLRHESIGGSARLPQYVKHSLAQKSIDPHNRSPCLPPRTPVRNVFKSSSLRSRPPPPPYMPTGQQVFQLNESSDCTLQFEPKSHSTPKKLNDFQANINGSSSVLERQVVGEGEQRESTRDKEERFIKTLSYYENVNVPTSSSDTSEQAKESTMWFEYGCV